MLQLYKNIKDRRKQLKMTQDELAKRTGYTDRSSIAKIEQGKIDLPESKIKIFADALLTTPSELYGYEGEERRHERQSIWIHVLGSVRAGIPVEAITDIVDHEAITPQLAASGDFFALQIKGDSMQPRMFDGDVVIVRQQEDVDSGDTAIVLVNGEEATCKKIKKEANGIWLIGLNSAFTPLFYSNDDIVNLPVRIVGKVIELRGKM